MVKNTKFDTEKTKEVLQILAGLSYRTSKDILDAASSILDNYVNQQSVEIPDALFDKFIGEEIESRRPCYRPISGDFVDQYVVL